MLILLCLLVVVAAGLAAFLVVGVVTAQRSVGFVPMPREVVARMVELSEVKPGERVIDLGSGDGRLVRAFAKAGARAEGVEMQWVLVWASRLMSASWPFDFLRQSSGWAAQGLRHADVPTRRPVFRCGDLWSVDLSGYDVVAVYAFPRMMEGLEEKLEQELKPGARVVLYTFPLPHWEPVRVEGKVFVYIKEKLGAGS